MIVEERRGTRIVVILCHGTVRPASMGDCEMLSHRRLFTQLPPSSVSSLSVPRSRATQSLSLRQLRPLGLAHPGARRDQFSQNVDARQGSCHQHLEATAARADTEWLLPFDRVCLWLCLWLAAPALHPRRPAHVLQLLHGAL